MKFKMFRGISSAEEAAYMLFHYANDISYLDYHERLVQTQSKHLSSSVVELYKKEFARLESIKERVCESLDKNHPIIERYFKNISEYSEEPFGLFSIVFGELYDFCQVNDYDGMFSHLSKAWNKWQREGYSLKSDGVSWSVVKAEPSDDPYYLLLQTNNLPYSKDICLKLYLFLNSFDDELTKIKEFMRPYAEKLTVLLSEDTSRTDYIMDCWEGCLGDMNYTDYMRSISGFDRGYDDNLPVFVRFFRMRPAYIFFSTPDENGAVRADEYFLSIGIGILPQFKFMGFSLETDKVIETLKLMGSKTKFEIMKRVKDKPMYCTELANELGMNRGHMSRNLTTLRYAGLLSADSGGRGYYSLNREYLEALLNCVRETFLGD